MASQATMRDCPLPRPGFTDFDLPTRMKANRRLAGCKCSYCHDFIEVGQEIRNCEHCRLVYHLECWAENQGCGVYGCINAPLSREAPAAVAAEPVPALERPKSPLTVHYEPPMEYAGFWLRVSAFLIDFVLILAAIAAVGLGAAIGFESSYRQATWGKAAVGIIVTDLEGDRITLGRANGRFCCKCLSIAPIFLGCLLAGLTSKKQALHDFMSATMVIRK